MSLVRAWNGGVLASIGGRPYLLVHGGGHGDYAGNEIVSFGPLDVEGPQWRQVINSTPGSLVSFGEPYNLDGRPNVSHTRSTMAYLGGRFWKTPQAGPYPLVNATRTFDSFDMSGGRWAAAGAHPNSPSAGSVRGALLSDSARNLLWLVPDGTGARLSSFNPSSNAWTTYTPSVTTGNTRIAALSPSRDEIFAHCDTHNALYSLSSPNSPPETTGFTGTNPGNGSGLVWDEGRQRYVALDPGLARNTVRELNPATKVWSTRTFTGTYEPNPDDAAGIFGRFQYVPALRGYIYVASTSGAVYFYRSH